MNVSDLFEPCPPQWGLRGDPYLWREFKERFLKTPLPETENALRRLLEDAYREAVGTDLTESEHFFVVRFAHGGMSSGMISPRFWREKAFPLIVLRFSQSSNEH